MTHLFSAFSICRSFIFNLPFCVDIIHVLHMGIIVSILLYFQCNIKIWILNPPKKYIRHGFLKWFLQEFSSTSKIIIKIYWCTV